MPTTHTVQAGETLVTIAHKHGFREWRAIWDHPENAPLRAARPDPDILKPGDQVFVPDKVPQQFTCPTNKRHRFRLKDLTSRFSVVLRDAFGAPYGDKRYTFELGGVTTEGRTGEDGLVSHEIPPDATEAKLTLWPVDGEEDSLTWTVQLGHLQPISTVPGAKARLSNLGFGCGDVTSEALDDDAVAAIKAFQQKYGLPMSGQLTPETLEKLERLHGA